VIVWNDNYGTGVKTVDDQHKLLILHINQLENLLKNQRPDSKDVSLFYTVSQFLEQYADMHFKFEEQCMESYRCPMHAKNKEQHAQFSDTIKRFNQRINAEGFNIEAFDELHRFTSSWITSHILRVDTQLLSCVKPG